MSQSLRRRCASPVDSPGCWKWLPIPCCCAIVFEHSIQSIAPETPSRPLRKDKAPLFTGVAKVDLSAPGDACVAKIQFPAGRTGGEVQFVPADNSESPISSPNLWCVG